MENVYMYASFAMIMGYISSYFNVIQLILVPLGIVNSFVSQYTDSKTKDVLSFIIDNFYVQTKFYKNNLGVAPLGLIISFKYRVVGSVTMQQEVVSMSFIGTNKNVDRVVGLVKSLSEIKSGSGPTADSLKKEITPIKVICPHKFDPVVNRISHIYTPNEQQRKIIDMIKSKYEETKSVVVFISGPTGSGKSQIQMMLAKEIGGFVMYDYDPTGSVNFSGIVAHDVSKPIVLSIDEVDVPIETAYSGVLSKERYTSQYAPHVFDKRSLNSMFDYWHNMHINGVWIMTSNKTREEIQEITDKSILRNGRVDLYFNLYEDIDTVVY